MAFTYLGALFSETRICTNNYILQQFPKETNTRGSESILKNIMLRLQNNINALGDLKTDAFEC